MGYGIKIFVPRPLRYVTRSPGDNEQKKGTENRRGRSKRNSYTVEFKKQTLDLLDTLSNSKHKWKRVADEKQVSKCLVVK